MDIDPAWWEQPAMRAVLAARDIGEVYRALKRLGVNQRRIATLVGQCQSEVSEIIKGRVVKDYDVLEHRQRSRHPPGVDGSVLVGR